MHCPLGSQHVCCTSIENLSVKGSRDFILKGVNLHLHCGELTAIVGKNGSGKSTFIKALLNLVPHTGKISFEREQISGNAVLGRGRKILHRKNSKPVFGYVPQSLDIEKGNPVSVLDLVTACTSRCPVWIPLPGRYRAKAEEILRTTNASHLLDRRVGDLSGGELQRVMLALAIHPLPDILLLDEPVSGVDRAGLKTFYELVSSLRRDYDITILLISHDLDLVARYADRVVFMNNASAKVGRVDEIYGSKEFTDVFGHIVIEEK